MTDVPDIQWHRVIHARAATWVEVRMMCSKCYDDHLAISISEQKFERILSNEPPEKVFSDLPEHQRKYRAEFFNNSHLCAKCLAEKEKIHG